MANFSITIMFCYNQAMKKPHSKFPILTVRRVLHLFIIVLVFAVVIWIIPWVKILTDVNPSQETELKAIITMIFSIAVVMWGIIIAIPYAMWLRATGLAKPKSVMPTRNSITNIYYKEIQNYDIIITPKNKWQFYEFLLVIAWLMITIILIIILLNSIRDLTSLY